MQSSSRPAHEREDIARAISRFFAVRGLIRTRLAQGEKFDPSAWLRVETLKFIAHADAPRSKDVADYLSITAPSATSIVAGLVRDGLVVRTRDPHDRRAHRLVLSSKGKRTLERTIARGTALLAGLFAPFSAHELAVFTRTLERILAAAREDGRA